MNASKNFFAKIAVSTEFQSVMIKVLNENSKVFNLGHIKTKIRDCLTTNQG
jgi:hypothetical protein